ncbi:hypothetical protein BHE74_00038750, partial [Ensete ventricosum]
MAAVGSSISVFNPALALLQSTAHGRLSITRSNLVSALRDERLVKVMFRLFVMQVPFGYTRKDVLLIGLGVTLAGIGLKSGLEVMLFLQLSFSQ